jgi:hypothetical protein
VLERMENFPARPIATAPASALDYEVNNAGAAPRRQLSGELARIAADG